jgi:lambda family phage tail tape measure protein
MADTVGRLEVVLDARIQQFEAKVAKAESRLRRSGAGMEKSAGKLDKSIAGLTSRFGALVTVAGSAALARGLDRSITRLDAIGKTADRLGLTTTALQEMRSAAQQSGVSVQTLDMAMQRFGRRVAEARQGTGEAKAVIKELGIDLFDAAGRARSIEDVLEDVADKMSKMEDQTDRNRVAMKLFDSEGVALVNMLGKGSEAFRDMKEAATGVIGEAEIRNAEAFRNEIDLLVQHIEGKALGAIGRLAIDIRELLGLKTVADDMASAIPAGPGALEALASGAPIPRGGGPTSGSGGSSSATGGGRKGSSKAKRRTDFADAIQAQQEAQKLALEDLQYVGATEEAMRGLESARAAATVAQKLENAAKAEGRELTAEETVLIADLALAYGDVTYAISQAEAAHRAQTEAAEASKQAIEDIGNSIAGAISQADSFEDALKRVAVQLANLAIQGLFGAGPLGPALGGAGQGIGSSIASIFSAKGNAFGSSGVIPFAKGGVVDRPTVFPFAKGTGVMGEAGPEAILPLKRGPGGRLGVESAGGGTTIHQVNNFASGVDRAEQERFAAQIKRETVAAISEARRENPEFLA